MLRDGLHWRVILRFAVYAYISWRRACWFAIQWQRYSKSGAWNGCSAQASDIFRYLTLSQTMAFRYCRGLSRHCIVTFQPQQAAALSSFWTRNQVWSEANCRWSWSTWHVVCILHTFSVCGKRNVNWKALRRHAIPSPRTRCWNIHLLYCRQACI